jgi:hypothetical protein
MARFDPSKTGFVAGELSPLLEARDDIDAYAQGMRHAVNGIVLPHGGFKRRPGTRWVAEVKASANRGRLVPFISSVDAAYIIEAGNLYFRYYVDEGRLESPPGTPVETTTVFPHTALADLGFTQSSDTLWVFHPDYHPYKLQRASATSFTLTKIAWRNGHAPMRPTNLTTVTITVTKPGTPYTLTASSATFSTGDVGRYIRQTVGSTEAWYRVDTFTSTTVVECSLMGGSATTGLGASTDWALGLFSDTEGPRAAVLHGGRLWYGGTYNQPDRITGSSSDDFDYFEYGSNDDNAISRRATNGSTNAIQWLASTDDSLCIGTQSGEFVVEGDSDGIITPSACFVRSRSRRGSTHDTPVVVADDVIYVQRNARKLREFHGLKNEPRSQASRDLTILAEHVLNSGATEVCYQQDPHSVVWSTRGDGVLVGVTHEPAHQVYAAHRHVLGGSYLTGNPIVESVAVIPSPDGDQDHLWLLVSRTINGSTKRYVEFMTDDYRPSVTARSTEREKIAAVEDAIFVDCSLTLDSPITISGITKANPGVVTAASHGLSNGDRVRIRDVLGMTEVNHTSFKVANVGANTFELTSLAGANVNTSGYSTYVAGGTAREEVRSVSGLSHLNGETVQILADGCVQTEAVVTAGAVSFTRWASIVHVGLACPFEGETQRFFGGSPIGAGQGNQAKISKVVARIHNTVGLELAVTSSPDATFETIPFRQGGDNFDEPPALRVSDDVSAPVNGGSTREPTVQFRNRDPLPCTILALYPRMSSDPDQ